MSTSSSAKRGKFWRSDWFVGVLVVLAVVILNLGTDFIGTLERRYYDFAATSGNRQPSDRIAIIAIDDQSIANIGRWPWSRDVHAQMIDMLAAAKAKTVVYNAFFFEPQTDRGLVYIRKIKETLGLGAPAAPAAAPSALDPAAPAAAAPAPAPQDPVSKLIAEAEQALDTDGKLAASMTKAGNVLVPSYFVLGEPQGKADKPLPAFALKSAIDENNGFSVLAVSTTQPIDSIGNAAAGIGHLNQLNDVDGAVRTEPMLVNYYGKAVPSMALMAAAQSLNLSPKDIRLNTGESVQIGKLRVKTDESARMLPQFYKGTGAKPAFAVDSFYDVLSGKIPAAKYANKIVIIGPTAAGVGVQFPAPGYAALTPVEMIAHITSSILGEHFLVQPGWGRWAALGAFLLVAGYLIGLLPRLSAGMSGAITAALFIVLLGAEYGLLAGASTWLPLVYPAMLLVIGHLALTTKRFLVTEAGKLKSDAESAETNRMMGLAEQGQGRLDQAFDRFRRVPMGDEVMGNLYNLALDFERKRQFNKAQAVYEHMAAFNPKYKDLEAKLNRAKNLSETVILGGGGGHPGGTMLLDGGGVEKPMLGRYQVEKELGKGAMGVVYLGKDPKIGRVVAIKTMALSNEFEGEELNDARERFFREAETAGRLQHQNIVTIFDAGEEHELAYIAMEFLKGKDLVDQCKDGHLLPIPRVLSIVARVAEALAYAHRQNVVHRDIKPANIMYEPESDVVKVTDFGIARITDSSKTKTGLVLGTPSFMSPEQIAGKKVDGRSDLYSLGVMLFQMLTGVLPFRGDSMAELMYKIANEEAPDIRLIRKDVSPQLAEIVAFSLAKKSEARYQDGDTFAAALKQVINDMTGGATAPMRAAAPAAAPQAARPAPAVSAVAAATGAAEKTAAFQRPPPGAAAAQAEKTLVMAPGAAPAAGAGVNFEATQPASAARGFAATVPAGNAQFAATVPAGNAPGFAATVPSGPGSGPAFAATQPASAAPGYDAAQKQGGAGQGPQFDKTSVMTKPAAPGAPGAGGGKTDQEP
ncbi:CHASE2 domain-containing protein [Caenimonas sedimenti]|uniref:non-specific serine/threonine protein kinase n=1 Tax=Caenimonas sedimenti TaxID=2596921 RepID=A0A562ZG21_9BURK|nr:serine/threonine-protein kinase [Caenimonas sedimenti]TWO66662.1 CHASE2 domain-containing protein [Caenimonas sedimenti]